jgi:hypothetical protein
MLRTRPPSRLECYHHQILPVYLVSKILLRGPSLEINLRTHFPVLRETNAARSAPPPSVSNNNFYAMSPKLHSSSEPDHERMFVPSQAMHVVQQAVSEPVSSSKRWPVLGMLPTFRQRS